MLTPTFNTESGKSGTISGNSLPAGTGLPTNVEPVQKALTYVLITPARDEAAFIEQTIKCVVSQMLRPAKWVIVSDGSTDGTDEIVKKYTAQHPWIELVRMPERRERHFAAKVEAFKTGTARLTNMEYDVIGNLDADVTFDEDYFQFLLMKFGENPGLGVAGTPFREGTRQYDYRFTSIEHVSGACQLFRRECFEEIGGYVPIKTGGIDLVAVITARMKGWRTRSFPEKAYIHHRRMGIANRNTLTSFFHGGYTDYTHGCDPVWEMFRCIYQMSRPPILLRGGVCFVGYLWALVTRSKRVVPADMVQFRKTEQRRRLWEFARRQLHLSGITFKDFNTNHPAQTANKRPRDSENSE
jgi:poly-beta-1,6-N-acetyl-D-glucosamine synthase